MGCFAAPTPQLGCQCLLEQFWGQGAARRGDFAGPPRLEAAKPSGLPLACMTSVAASSQGLTVHKMCVPHLAVPWRKALPSSTKPPCPHACPAQCWGRWPSRGRAPGAQISLLQSHARWLGLGMASCTLASFLNGLCFIHCSQLPLLGHRSGWAWGGDLPIGSWSCSAGGPGNAAFPLVPSLTPWAGGTHSHGATLAMGFPHGSTVMAVLSLAGHWKAGEGTPQDAGALGEQVCRWEAAFCACLSGSGLPVSSSLLEILGCAGTANSP